MPPDLDRDILTRPIADVVTDICRDFGLFNAHAGAPSFQRRTPEDIRRLCAQAEAAARAVPHPPIRIAANPRHNTS